jgi:hypothetical protein
MSRQGWGLAPGPSRLLTDFWKLREGKEFEYQTWVDEAVFLY